MDTDPEHPFDEDYFRRGPYASVSFEKYSQYWWSNRFYATLALRYGPPSGRVLEVGCGLGHLLTWFAAPYKVFGTDINSWALEQARQTMPDGSFLVVSAEDLGAFTNAQLPDRNCQTRRRTSAAPRDGNSRDEPRPFTGWAVGACHPEPGFTDAFLEKGQMDRLPGPDSHQPETAGSMACIFTGS